MRLESLAIGIAILLFGIYLVSTQGVVAGYDLPKLVGLPSSNPGSGNATPGFGFAGFGVGTIVALSGLGMIMNGLRAPSASMGFGRKGADGSMPPEMAAALAAMQSHLPPSAPTGAPPVPPGAVAPPSAPSAVQYCVKCGRANALDAKFCQQCGTTVPSLPPAAPPS